MTASHRPAGPSGEFAFQDPTVFPMRPSGALTGALTILILATPIDAAPGPRPLRFGTPRELPSAGLRVPLPQGAEESPLPSPQQHPYRVRDAKGEREEMFFDPVELWRHGQVEGAWTVPEGGRFVIAAVRSLPPPASAGFLPRDAGEKLVRETTAPPAWTAEALAGWIAAFVGAPPGRLDAITPLPATVREGWRAVVEPANVCLIGFRPVIGSTIRRTASTNLYVACVFLPAGSDALPAMNALAEDFLPRVSAFRPAASAGDGAAPNRFRNHRVWNGAEVTAELEASRKQVLESIRNLRDWWSVDTPHFVLLSNLPARNRNGVRDMQASVERFRDAFERVLPPPDPIRSVSVIRIFATDTEYDAYVGPNYRWTAGLWMAQRRELVVRPVLDGPDSDAQRRFLRIVAHEAFHQYLDSALGHVETSPWFNEGLACFFERASIDRERMTVPESPEHVALLEPAARKGRLDAAELMRASYLQFYSGSREELASHYAQAWGLIYFLQKSARHDKKSACSGILVRYLQAIAAGRDANAATAAVLAEVDPATLNREFNAFWISNAKRQAARRNAVLPCSL